MSNISHFVRLSALLLMMAHSMEPGQIQKLINGARQSMQHSYCPYSKFPVGCALLCVDGSIYTGCNVENSAYSGCICAERTALVKAVSDGKRKFKAICVTSNLDDYCSPCGTCRQSIFEFGKDTMVILSKPNGEYKTLTIEELLPLGFSTNHLSDFYTQKNVM